MFNVILIAFIIIIIKTLYNEYRRTRGVTLIALISIGNFFYCALTYIVSSFKDGSAVDFEKYIDESGVLVDDLGLTRSILAATLFQLGCLAATFRNNTRKIKYYNINPDTYRINSAVLVGLEMTFLVLLVSHIF